MSLTLCTYTVVHNNTLWYHFLLTEYLTYIFRLIHCKCVHLLFYFHYSIVYYSIVYYSIAMQHLAQEFPLGLIKFYLILS